MAIVCDLALERLYLGAQDELLAVAHLAQRFEQIIANCSVLRVQVEQRDRLHGRFHIYGRHTAPAWSLIGCKLERVRRYAVPHALHAVSALRCASESRGIFAPHSHTLPQTRPGLPITKA